MANNIKCQISITAWKVSKYGVFSGPYFPVFSPNRGKYGQEKLRIRSLLTQWIEEGQDIVQLKLHQKTKKIRNKKLQHLQKQVPKITLIMLNFIKS